MNSYNMRNNPLFLRNQYCANGKWEIPLVKKQEINLSNISLISCADVRYNDNDENRKKGVHFFVDDYRFDRIFDNPQKSLKKYSQYSFLLTPDYSLYADMPMWKQMENVAKNRWCGAYWQAQGLTVYPSVSWGSSSSYEFCFDGIESNAVVAIGMIGCKRNKSQFLRGYDRMLEKLNPSTIICFGSPFAEMQGNIIPVDYLESRKVVR